MNRTTLTETAAAEPLTQHEIDRRIGDVAAQVLGPAAREEADASDADLRPHWISASELVQRMRPFMVLN